MTHLLFDRDAEIAQWWLERDREPSAFNHHYVVGLLDAQYNLRGAFTVSQVSPAGVVIGVYSEGGLNRTALRGIFAFIFEHLGASRCEMVTRKTNKVMKKHAPNLLGFRFEGVRRDWYGPGQDGLAFYMTPATCKWIENHGLSIAA